MANRNFMILGRDEELIHPMRTPGFVYFIQGGGLIKIGWTTGPEGRLREMQAHCPVRLEILLAVPGNGALEKELHALIATWRENPPPAPVWTGKPRTRYAPKSRRPNTPPYPIGAER